MRAMPVSPPLLQWLVLFKRTRFQNYLVVWIFKVHAFVFLHFRMVWRHHCPLFRGCVSAPR